MENDTFSADFDAAKRAGDSDERASRLVQLCKDHDLRDPKCAEAVRIIASWIDSPDDSVRREVAFALCFYRPVRGFEYVATQGWKTAPPADLHWYAGALTSCIVDPKQVTWSAAEPIAATLLREAPTRESSGDELAYRDALDDHRNSLEEAYRVVSHFHGLLCRELDLSRIDETQSEAPVDWRIVAEVLYHCGKNARAHPS